MPFTRHLTPLLALLTLLTLAPGCGDETSGDMCVSGEAWMGKNEGSSLMRPGRDCLACHKRKGEGEEVVLAGTVYASDGEPSGCFGLEGVTLELTDNLGEVREITSNAAGNFVLESPVVTPYTVKLTYEGRERVMIGAQTQLSCNNCHSENGANGAPGRIIAP